MQPVLPVVLVGDTVVSST